MPHCPVRILFRLLERCWYYSPFSVSDYIGQQFVTFAFTCLSSFRVSSGGAASHVALRTGLVWSGLSTTPTFSYFSVHRVLTPDQVCVVLNNKGVRVCTVCKSPYKASVRLPGGESISLFQSPLPPPYICFMVVTRHQNNEVRCARFCEE